MSKLHPDRVELGSLTTTQRNALSGLPAGTVIYNSTDGIVQHWNGSSWISMSNVCLLYTSPSPRDKRQSRMPSSA